MMKYFTILLVLAFLQSGCTRKEPVELQTVINALPAYKKKAKEVPERFEQEFAHL